MSSTSIPKPPSPPPSYTEVDASQYSGSSRPPVSSHHNHQHHSHQHQHGHHHNALGSPLAFPAHPGYGPTPIANQHTHVLPYYDPRSPYAIAEANSRARWRFVGAFIWALLILAILSVLCGVEVQIQRQPWRGWWLGSGNSDPWMDQ